MAAALDRLRAVPRQWLAAGGATAFGAVVLLSIVATAGGDASTPTADSGAPTSQGVVTNPAPRSSATTADDPTRVVVTPGAPTSTDVRALPSATFDLTGGYALNIDDLVPAVEGRTVPDESDEELEPIVTFAPPPWASQTRVTAAGHVSTEVGCADDISAEALDRFLADRVGPVLGWDYQHVYPLGDGRYLWLFQDVFLDHSGTRHTLGSSRFVHNGALVQDGACFTLLHRGSPERPDSFEVGDGSVDLRTKWLWPLGGELADGRLQVFWAEMVKDPYDPDPPNGLGWHPSRTFLATYDTESLERVDYREAMNPDVSPIYGYAVASDLTHTYLFGNTFEQNMLREGGFWNGPHSATRMYLARVRRGMLLDRPEYRTADGWSLAAANAVPIVERFYAENPMQPRFLDGQWVSATAVDGYWGDHLAVDVAAAPWGPWVTVQYDELLPRGADPLMNTYHAQPLPWRDEFGSLQITVSNNARNMRRDAWDAPHRYRPSVMFAPYAPTPTTTTTTTTIPPTTTTLAPTTTTRPTTTRPTTTRPTTTTTTPSTTTTTSTTTTMPPTSTAASTSTSTTTSTISNG